PAVHRRPAWAVFLLAGALAGIYAFIASATRGGLVAVPIFAVLAAVALLRRQYLRPLMAGCAVLVAGAAIVMTALPVGQIAEGRYASAMAEWDAYIQDGN